VIARWPGVTRPGTTSPWPVSSTDHFPTILEAAGLPALPDQHRDGVSFVPAMKNPSADNPERPLFWHYPHWGNQGGTPGAAVRLGDWKLIKWFWGKPPELFNLADDPGEQHNLAGKQPQKLAQLTGLLERFHRDTGALMPAENPQHRKPFDKW
jgi:arylsulfatase A-like enzyme